MRPVEEFDELLEILMPWAGGFAVMLRTFIDASTRESEVFCVACVAFGADRAKKAERAWRALMGDRIAHLTDMHARRGAFSGFTAEEGGEMLKTQIQIIKNVASFGVAFSCDLSEINKLLPTDASTGSETAARRFQTRLRRMLPFGNAHVGRHVSECWRVWNCVHLRVWR